jgi:hypothetical protein
MLLCDNCNGGYHLFCLKPELTCFCWHLVLFITFSYNTLISAQTMPRFSRLRSWGDTWKFHLSLLVATPLWGKCEGETHTPKSGNLESFGTPKTSELDYRGQNTLHWTVLYIVGKVLNCKCPKWLDMSHLDICSTSYGQKKGRESNWQFDSRPLKVGNRPNPGVCAGGVWHTLGKLLRRVTSLLQTSSQSEVGVRSHELPKSQESKPG